MGLGGWMLEFWMGDDDDDDGYDCDECVRSAL